MRAVIVNPASECGRTALRWRRIVGALDDGGASFEVELTSGPGDAISLTRKLIADGASEITVLGGDGTVGEVVAGCIRPDGSGMLHDDLVLNVIHQGTGGDFARGMCIPKDELGAIRTAREGLPTRIDVGVARYTAATLVAGTAPVAADLDADGQHVRGFASVANIGMAADVVERVDGPMKRFGKNGSFALATVACLIRNRPRPVRVVTTEGVDSMMNIVDIDVCNNRFMGGGMLVAPGARADDGLFDVILISAARRLKLIRTFPKIYSGRHIHDPLVRVEQSRKITIETAPGDPVQRIVLDGELTGTTPATFEVIPAALSIRLPRDGSLHGC
ncbi:MAG: diacylglycerol kinase family protein [Gaiellales bacterium]